MKTFWAIDPGGVTGYAIFRWSGQDGDWESAQCRIALGLDYHEVVRRLTMAFKQTAWCPDEIVIEDFRLWMDRRQDKNAVGTIKQIGGFELLAWQHDTPVVVQPNTINSQNKMLTAVRDVHGIKLESDGFGKDARSAELHGWWRVGIRP